MMKWLTIKEIIILIGAGADPENENTVLKNCRVRTTRIILVYREGGVLFLRTSSILQVPGNGYCGGCNGSRPMR